MSRVRSRVGVMLCLAAISIVPANADWELENFAGGGPHLLPALESNLDRPTSVARDATGTSYVLTGEQSDIYRITPAGVLEIAFVPGTDDRLDDLVSWPFDLESDSTGRLLIAGERHIVRVDMSSGEITDVPLDVIGYSIAASSDGATYVLTGQYSKAERQLYRVDWVSGETELVAGATCGGFPPNPACFASFEDGMLGTAFALRSAVDLQVAANGDVYIGLHGVLRFDAADGRLYRLAGGGSAGFAGDGEPALGASFWGFSYLALDPVGNILVSDSGNHRVRRIDAATGLIDTIVGDGTAGFSGDGGPAILAQLNLPAGLTVGSDGAVWIADTLNMRVRRYDPVTGVLTTTAGNGWARFSGDGYPATRASITGRSLALDAAGNAYIPDTYNHRIRKVDHETGLISTYAGTGADTAGVEDDGLPAGDAVFPFPDAVAVDPSGNVFVVLRGGRLRRIEATTGLVSTVPGWYSRIALDGEGRLYTTVSWGQIARVDIENGDQTPVAGNGLTAYNGEGVPALEAGLWPIGVFRFSDNGDLYLIGNKGLIRKVDAATGLIHTIAGGASDSLARLGRVPQTVPAIGSYFAPGYLAVRGSTVLVSPWRDGSGVARIDVPTGRAHWHLGIGPYNTWDPPPLPEVNVFARSLELDDDGNWYLGKGDGILLARNTNRAPAAWAGGNRSVSCESNHGSRIVLNGSASSDLDDEPGAEAEIVEYWWFEDFGLPSQRRIAAGPIAEVTLPIGTHDITLQTGDRWGSRTTDTITIDVFDDLDPDGDGMGSCVDNCPAVSNLDQADDDGNGLGDVCDPCLGGLFDDDDGDAACADIDNCPALPNPQQLDSDSDGVGDACDTCPETANPDQTEHGVCLAPRQVDQCLAIDAEMSGEGHRGRVLISHADRVVPTVLGFQATYRTDNPITIDLYLNDVSLGTWEPAITSWECATSWFYVLDADFIALVWKPAQENEFRIVQSGEGYVAQVRVHFLADVGIESTNLYGSSNTQCGSWLPTNFDHTAVIRDPYYQWEEVLDFPFGPEPLSSSIDLEGFPNGDYRLCIAATDSNDPGTLYAATRLGELYRIDSGTAEPSLVGALPAVAVDIAHDAGSGTSLLSTGLRTLYSFDIRDAVGLAPRVITERSYGELEFLPSGLVGAATSVVVNDPWEFWTSLYRVNATDGTSEYIGTMDQKAIYGLDYNESDGELRAFTGHTGSGPIELSRVDRHTAQLSVVGPTGQALAGLVTGPDGLLYAFDRYRDTQLYRVDPDSARVTPVGDMGLQWISTLVRSGQPGSIDCVEFTRQGEAHLELNASCGPPIAMVAPVADAECTSSAGGVVLLDGTASTDPNSDASTVGADLTYDWYIDHGTATERYLGSGAALEAVVSVGSHTITLRVTNRFGEASTAATTVSVFDEHPPTMTLTAAPGTLWPPNHRMVDVTMGIEAHDNCGEPVVRLIEATSSEPDDAQGGGDGSTIGDIQSAEFGTTDMSIALRAERAGSGDGRVYTLTYEAMDAAGNSTSATTRVLVPHSQNGASEPLRVSLENTEVGTLVRWADVPGALYYNVIRGQLDTLRHSNDVVELNPLVCVDAGSLDNTTAGVEDATLPAAGAAFFYLAEYHDGWQPTSFGTESASRPRIAPSGVCGQESSTSDP